MNSVVEITFDLAKEKLTSSTIIDIDNLPLIVFPKKICHILLNPSSFVNFEYLCVITSSTKHFFFMIKDISYFGISKRSISMNFRIIEIMINLLHFRSPTHNNSLQCQTLRVTMLEAVTTIVQLCQITITTITITIIFSNKYQQ